MSYKSGKDIPSAQSLGIHSVAEFADKVMSSTQPCAIYRSTNFVNPIGVRRQFPHRRLQLGYERFCSSQSRSCAFAVSSPMALTLAVLLRNRSYRKVKGFVRQCCRSASGSSQYGKELAVALDTVQRASIAARSLQDSIVTSAAAVQKSDKDGTGFGPSPVTVADFMVQCLVLNEISAKFSSDKFIAEETSEQLVQAGPATIAAVLEAVNKCTPMQTLDETRIFAALDLGATGLADGWSSSQRTWVLDPIDGTKGFLRGQQFAVALSLLVEGQPVIGVLGCPNLPTSTGTIYWAERNCGAFSKPVSGDSATIRCLQVDPTLQPGQVRICESAEAAHSSFEGSQRVAAILGLTAEPIRIDGQGKYGIVAQGDAHVYLRLPRKGYVENIWDHAAGTLIVEEAGGRVTDQRGHPLDFSKGAKLSAEVTSIIATNDTLHQKVVAELQKFEL